MLPLAPDERLGSSSGVDFSYLEVCLLVRLTGNRPKNSPPRMIRDTVLLYTTDVLNAVLPTLCSVLLLLLLLLLLLPSLALLCLVHAQKQNDERDAECDTLDCGEALRPPENGWRKRRCGGGGGGVVRGAEGLPR